MTFALIAQFVCIRIVFSIPSFDLSVTQPVSTLKLEQDQIESRYGSCVYATQNFINDRILLKRNEYLFIFT